MTGTPHRPVRKFSPGTYQSDEEVKEQFVVRDHELRVLLNVLRGNIQSPSCQHALIVAPRGRGKTMLLARAAAELRTNPEFDQHLLPVSFMEESQEIFNLTDFWLETLFHLARECASHDPQLADELRDRHGALSDRWREQTLEDHARAAVLDAADRLDRKLVLMVENLQALCKDVDKDFGWKLRGVLQTEPQIILLASATSRFAGLDDAEQPFFETFRIIELKPLTTEQCRNLWKVVSGDNVTGREIRPLEILTGGSPRLLVIVASFGQHKSLRRLMEELVMLIDDHTEYFRGHLDVLGKTERRIYIAVLDLWQQSTPGEIAARARMDVRVVSTMLGRLVERGALVVEGGGRKRKYAAAEPLYCIYYKLRRGRGEAAVVENLIRFMSVFYSEAEQTEIFPSLISEGLESSTLRHGLDRAAAELPEFAKILAGIRQPAIAVSRPGETEPARRTLQELAGSADATVPHYEPIEQLLKEISAASDSKAYERVVEIVDRSASIQNPACDGLSQPFAAWALTMKGDALRKLDNLDSALCAYEYIDERFHANEDPHVQTLVARAFAQKGQVQEQSGNPKSALLAYDEIVARFGDSEYPTHREWVARALIRNAHILREVADSDTALSAYEEVVKRFGTSQEPEPQRCVASALIGKGYILEHMGETKSALASYGKVMERFGASEDLGLKQWVAEALHFQGDCLRRLRNLDSALSTYHEIVQRFTDNPDIQLQRDVARALTATGYVRQDLGEPKLALSACRDVVERFGANDNAEVSRFVAEALFLRGNTLRTSGDADLALSTYDEIVERFEDKGDVELQRWVAESLTSKGQSQTDLGDSAGAVSTYDAIIQRFGCSEFMELAGYAAAAMNRKGDALVDLNDSKSALAAFDDFLERFGRTEDASLQEWIAKTLVNKGDALRGLDQLDLAASTYREAVERFGSSDDANMLWWVSAALARTGRVLRESGDLNAAVASCDDTVQRFGTSENPRLRQWVALATIEKAEMLIEMGRVRNALHTCDYFDTRLRNLDDERKRELAWRARQVWTRALLVQPDLPAALDMFRSLHDTFVSDDDGMMRDALQLIPELIVAGASVRELLDILSSDTDKAAALAPLIVALRQHSGEPVQEPDELLQVAADVRKRIQEVRTRTPRKITKAAPGA